VQGNNFRLVLGGSEMLEVEVGAEALLPNSYRHYKLRLDIWPRDIAIRLNMATSDWFDLGELVNSNSMAIKLQDGSPDSDDSFLTELDAEGSSAAIRWAVIADDGGKLALQLQGLPGSAELLTSKPSLRGKNASN